MHTGLKSLYDQSFIMQDMSTRMCALHTRTPRRAGRTAAPHGAEYSSTPKLYPPRECACAAAAVPPVHARARAYKYVSFASEPIQPPIVPVKPFESR